MRDGVPAKQRSMTSSASPTASKILGALVRGQRRDAHLRQHLQHACETQHTVSSIQYDSTDLTTSALLVSSDALHVTVYITLWSSRQKTREIGGGWGEKEVTRVAGVEVGRDELLLGAQLPIGLGGILPSICRRQMASVAT